MTEEKINRINELAKKSKTVGLTDDEKEEQNKLRKEYINSIKQNLRHSLNQVTVSKKN